MIARNDCYQAADSAYQPEAQFRATPAEVVVLRMIKLAEQGQYHAPQLLQQAAAQAAAHIHRSVAFFAWSAGYRRPVAITDHEDRVLCLVMPQKGCPGHE